MFLEYLDSIHLIGFDGTSLHGLLEARNLIARRPEKDALLCLAISLSSLGMCSFTIIARVSNVGGRSVRVVLEWLCVRTHRDHIGSLLTRQLSDPC